MRQHAFILLIVVFYLAGCASVPMASDEVDQRAKEFSPPAEGMAGLYIYRNSYFGAALRKSVYVDDELIGRTAPMTYFYKEVEAGERKVSTQSEFGNNELIINTEAGQHYFIQQYIKLGVLVGGANIKLMSEEEGKKGVMECKLVDQSAQLAIKTD